MFWKSVRTPWRARAVSCLILVPLVVGTQSPAAGRWHVHLLKSEPAANDTLRASPAAIKLWFSGPPEMAVTTVKLASASGAAVPVAAPTRDTAADAPVTAAIARGLPAGDYVITWRTTAQDGHPSNGTIPFVVAASAH